MMISILYQSQHFPFNITSTTTCLDIKKLNSHMFPISQQILCNDHQPIPNDTILSNIVKDSDILHLSVLDITYVPSIHEITRQIAISTKSFNNLVFDNKSSQPNLPEINQDSLFIEKFCTLTRNQSICFKLKQTINKFEHFLIDSTIYTYINPHHYCGNDNILITVRDPDDNYNSVLYLLPGSMIQGTFIKMNIFVSSAHYVDISIDLEGPFMITDHKGVIVPLHKKMKYMTIHYDNIAQQ